MHVSTPNTTTISDLLLGATLAYLGYPVEMQPTIHEATRKRHVQFFFEKHSTRFTSLPDLNTLLTQWRKKQLGPQHLMSVCMRAHDHYDAINRWQKEGVQSVLRPVAQPHSVSGTPPPTIFEYQPGSPPPADGPLAFIDHLQLSAALGEVGFQVVAIRGQHREHSYGLPQIGAKLYDSHGQPARYHLVELSRLAPVPDDPRRLALEEIEPMHLVVVAYNLLRCRAMLKKQIDAMTCRVLIEDGERQALVGINPTGITMDHVSAHFKAPPLP